MDLVGQGTELALEMVRRERERAALERAYNPPSPTRQQASTISPQTLALAGGIADVIGTYAGLKRGVAREDNPRYANMAPGRIAMSLGGSLATERGISALLRKFLPKIAPAVDAFDANKGALQLSLASRWAELLTGDKTPEGGYAAYMDRFQRGSRQK